VQETIENHLARIFKTKITVYGCGRTDAGVHAAQYVAHINLKDTLTFDLKFRLNKNLPDEIVVYEVILMDDHQHARYDATARTYDYFIHFTKDPVLDNYSTLYSLNQDRIQDKPEQLDFNAMKHAADLICIGNKIKDFRHFCKQPDLHNHTLCQVENAKLLVTSAHNRVHFTMTANRFLRGMMRIIVASLIDIGLGKLSLTEFKNMLNNEGEETEKIPAHPNGLFLSEVRYPYLTLKKHDHLCALLKTGYENV
jgi:tRNA pseudouridine38-40 synthase